MKNTTRALLIGVGTLAVLAAGAAGLGEWLAERKMARRVEVAVAAVPVPDDPDRIARGRYLYETRGCTECHGDDGAGRLFIDDGAFRVRGPQIGPGPASMTARYRPEDWVRAIRHGVDPSGRALIVMPSEDYNRLSDADLGAMIAYVRGLPDVAGEPRLLELPLPVRLAYGFGVIRDAAEKIDHRLPPQPPIAESTSPEYGRYVAGLCIGCHGDGLSGGKTPGGPPDWPPAANLTPGEGSAMTRYPDAGAFAAMMRTGRRPDGGAIAVMPFESLARMRDVELQALYAYLKTLPPRPVGGR
jgi:mono/diheme cytochrome c family protein